MRTPKTTAKDDGHRATADRPNFLRPVLATLGFFSLALGLLGVFLPLMPTTPFVLLATYCFSKSSRRFDHWLRTNRVTSNIISDWKEHRSIPMSGKMACTLMLSLSLGYAFLKTTVPVWGRVAATLGVILILGFVWSRPTNSPDHKPK